MTSSRLGERLRGVHSGFLAFCLVLALAGIVLPSGSIGPAPGTFHDVTPSTPIQLIVPKIKLASRIVPIEVDDSRTLDPPADVRLVGWWRESARPGSTKGQTLLTGHTVHTGGGVMDKMGTLKPGDRVRVKTGEATLNYKVTQVKVYSRDQVTKYADSLFGQDREQGRLVLVTCTDWKDGIYQSNVIVFAEPDGVQGKPAKSTPTPVQAKAA